MSNAPSTTSRPEISSEQSPQQKLEALEEYYVEMVKENRELEQKLLEARNRQKTLADQADRLKRENVMLKRNSLYLATVKEVITETPEDSETPDLVETERGLPTSPPYLVIDQSGAGQEIVLNVPEDVADKATPGGRVAFNDVYNVDKVLDSEQDAKVAGMIADESPDVTYEDIGGLEEQIREVREAVERPAIDGEVFDAVGIDPPAGVLLHGPPGTGKTMLAKAVADAAGATFISVAASEFVQKLVGEGPQLVRDVFETAQQNAPAILFIDEIDAIAAKRTGSLMNSQTSVQRTLVQLLNELDGFDNRGDVRVMAATNRVNMLDDALLRPGRFDRMIKVPIPDAEGREAILDVALDDVSTVEAVNRETVVGETAGFSGAQISSVVSEAGMFALRDDRTAVTTEDLLAAVERVADDEPDEPPEWGEPAPAH